MKDNKIDDLFRQKLSHQKLTPPPSAWAAVAENLPEKKKKGIYFWISMAASILLICTLGWVMLSDEGTVTPNDQALSATTKNDKLKDKNPQDKVVQASKEDEIDNQQESTPLLKPNIEEPAVTEKLMASVSKQKVKTTVENQDNTKKTNEPTAETSLINREQLFIAPIDLKHNLSVGNLSREFDDMVMPLVLTDYFTTYNEDLKLTPKKKKFRVLNGIISIAKEVNSSKLSFSELRNKKNSFVNDDLKYGTKAEEDGDEDDSEDEPNKD